MSRSNPVAQRQISATRTMLYVMLAAPALLAVPVWFSIGEWGELPFWVVASLAGCAAIALIGCEMFGYNAAPVAPGTRREDAQQHAVTAWRASSMIRIALTDSVVLIGIVFAFVGGGMWPFVLGLVLGWPLMAWEALPTSRTVEKLTTKLERDGGHAHLAELFGLPDRGIR